VLSSKERPRTPLAGLYPLDGSTAKGLAVEDSGESSRWWGMFTPGTRYVLRVKAGAAPHRAEVAAAETKTFPSTIPVGRLLVSSGNNRNIAGLNNGVEPT
jgi:hypothetical protein